MENGTLKPKTWVDVASLAISLGYRVLALYLLRDLLVGQREISQLILSMSG